MKGKVIRGLVVLWLMKYLFGLDKTKKNKNARKIAGNLAPETPIELAKCFYEVWKIRRKKCSRPLLHIPLRMPKGEDVSDEVWVEIAKALMKKVGLSLDRPWLVVKHGNEHVHLVTSRIDYNGQLWYGRWEALELIKATHEIEKDFGLTQTPTLDMEEWKTTHPKNQETHQGESESRAGTEPKLSRRDVLAKLVPEAIARSNGSLQQFKAHLATKNVNVVLNKYKTTSRIYGVSFTLDGVDVKGSKVPPNYSWKNIVERLKTEKALLNQSIQKSIKELPTPVSDDHTPEILPDPPIKQAQPESVSVADPSKKIGVGQENSNLEATTGVVSNTADPQSNIENQPIIVPILKKTEPDPWQIDPDSWASVRQILVNTYQIAPLTIDFLHDRKKLWAVDRNTIVTTLRPLPVGKNCGLSRLRLDSENLLPSVSILKGQGVFSILNRLESQDQIIVTANAIEAMSYYELSKARHPECPQGFVVSVDGDLPPEWLVDLVKRKRKRLFLATKTNKNADEICAKLPRLLEQGRLAEWFEIDVSNCESWHQLLKQQKTRLPESPLIIH